jgi:endoglucanase
MRSSTGSRLEKSCWGAALLLWSLSGCSAGDGLATVDDAGLANPSPDAGAADAGTEPIVLIDDFEDGDGLASYRQGGWYSYTDQDNGGGSSLVYTGAAPGTAAMNGEGYQSTRSLQVTATFDQGTLSYQPYVGWGVFFAKADAPADFSAFTGIGYTYKGAAHRVRIETFEVKDYDVFGVDLPASTEWKTVRLAYTDFVQEGWGVKVPFNPKNVGNLSFAMRGNTGQVLSMQIDDLVFVTQTGPKLPDMTVNAPNPPVDGIIDSIAVTNPLQAKAMQYLSKGYNITNWLEQAAFTGFTYDEGFVAKLAAAGFQSLRLPVDLDRYATATGTGEAMTVTMDEKLFTVLDAFVEWTALYGLSLTIDFHQYDYSLDLSKPDSLTKAVLAWGKVAARYAVNPRADLFYELLNEPDLSFGGTAPTQAQWTALAQRMIDAIRAVDPTHTIIFGDTQWYAIGTLKARTPFADPNIIYAFHFYEPFIFTHQGAGWANMGSTHDIPYPYTAERWSPFFSALGFTSSMPAWILSAARGYYATGNKASIRNLILEAKRWGVANNAAVICNEFGVNDTTSRPEDVARYYTDLNAIFTELQIPWQIWFMIMDKTTGAVPPAYRAAFGLE